ncbi:MAG: DUF6468 domain-containing protein [Alphaproteobacteria bacterium]
MDNFEFALNLIIILLLIPTIIYAVRLNANLNIFRENQKSLARLVESLNDATFKAENSIPKLKNITQASSSDLKEVVVKATELKDDLSFINQRADNLADRLEGVIKDNREKSFKKKEEDNSEAELELLKALRSIK